MASSDSDLHTEEVAENKSNIGQLKGRKVSWAKLYRVDSLNLEAGKDDWKTILSLAFQSVGVIYGDLGTSPLYTIQSTFAEKIGDKDDILGVLSLIIYTIFLIPMTKYVFTFLWANDNGNVLSAVSGIKPLGQEAIVGVSVAILVALFCFQRFGTDKVGYSFAPAICIWFCLISGTGMYNLFKHDVSVLRAFNPKYIFDYFQRNGKKGWLSLGGVILCITG
ncbi:PREDICTED: potassium transporter 5-like [Nicotiana attenuata]|uniref:potassium transporter 5-like n=1 Tax=Nicotiana attenuata TaxID=49451 RepID=UPI000904D4C5|nr:PREDICTED: potassium transporter 5-like [Nicotiana attenuata]